MCQRKQKGFTLMEMLIVVAIIAILVAVAIPAFNSSLDTARKAADDANLRAAKAVAAVNYMTQGCVVSGCGGSCSHQKAYYDIERDQFVGVSSFGSLPEGYNQTEQSLSGKEMTLRFPKGTASVVTGDACGSAAADVYWYGDPRSQIES